MKYIFCLMLIVGCTAAVMAQQNVQVAQDAGTKTITVSIGGKLFTQFLFPDTLEKPVLYPINAANGTSVTRGYPLHPQPLDPTDHPHHIGLWLNFENVNGLDFWNNSFAIPASKKSMYGSIKTDRIIKKEDGPKGILAYHANWVDWKNNILLEETTQYEFSGSGNQRIVDRITT